MVDTAARAGKGDRVTRDPESDHQEQAASLSAELEAALLRELRSTYEDLNYSFFKKRLATPAFVLSDAPTRLGRWVSIDRTIEMSRRLVLKEPWGVVVEVLKHEMAHQFVFEVLGKHDESAHGPAFRDVCERLGIDASAAGMPVATTQSEDDARVLSRIAKLLALAESANVNEAQAAMSAAQRLMLKHNLESIADPRRPHAYGFRHLGKPTGRVTEHERLLGAILGKHFFVEVIWVPVYRPAEGKRGSVLEVCGSPTNLEMAAYVHAFLTHTSEHLWREHKRQKKIRGDRDRRTFLSGVMIGFLEKLNAQIPENREKGLVWVGDADLASFYRTRHPRIVHVRHAAQRRSEAHHHGREAGRKIVLHKPVGSGPSGGVKLLGR
jgi:predicted SprT family Zn-dependent metalloprotease